jgi:hypothetical protein
MTAAIMRVPEELAEIPPGMGPGIIEFLSLTVVSSPGRNMATLQFTVGGEKDVVEHVGGVGPVDAICYALQKLAPGFKLLKYSARSVEQGSAAAGHVNVVLEANGRKFGGVGQDPNLDVACTKAIISALNHLRTTEFRLALNTSN